MEYIEELEKALKPINMAKAETLALVKNELHDLKNNLIRQQERESLIRSIRDDIADLLNIFKEN